MTPSTAPDKAAAKVVWGTNVSLNWALESGISNHRVEEALTALAAE